MWSPWKTPKHLKEKESRFFSLCFRFKNNLFDIFLEGSQKAIVDVINEVTKMAFCLTIAWQKSST